MDKVIIEKLAEQATIIRKTFHGVEHVEFDKEKFAKLIVQECADLVEGFLADVEVADGEYVEYEASDIIKKHFGVE